MRHELGEQKKRKRKNEKKKKINAFETKITNVTSFFPVDIGALMFMTRNVCLEGLLLELGQVRTSSTAILMAREELEIIGRSPEVQSLSTPSRLV